MLSECLFRAESHLTIYREIAEEKDQWATMSSLLCYVNADKAGLVMGPCPWMCESPSGLKEGERTSPVLVKDEDNHQHLEKSPKDPLHQNLYREETSTCVSPQALC